MADMPIIFSKSTWDTSSKGSPCFAAIISCPAVIPNKAQNIPKPIPKPRKDS